MKQVSKYEVLKSPNGGLKTILSESTENPLIVRAVRKLRIDYMPSIEPPIELPISMCPVLLSLRLMIPCLYLGCFIWWELVPEITQLDVFNQNLGIEEDIHNAILSVGSGKIDSVLSHQIPHERAPYNIAMWKGNLTIAFAIGIVAFNYTEPTTTTVGPSFFPQTLV